MEEKSLGRKWGPEAIAIELSPVEMPLYPAEARLDSGVCRQASTVQACLFLVTSSMVHLPEDESSQVNFAKPAE